MYMRRSLAIPHRRTKYPKPKMFLPEMPASGLHEGPV